MVSGIFFGAIIGAVIALCSDAGSVGWGVFAGSTIGGLWGVLSGIGTDE